MSIWRLCKTIHKYHQTLNVFDYLSISHVEKLLLARLLAVHWQSHDALVESVDQPETVLLACQPIKAPPNHDVTMAEGSVIDDCQPLAHPYSV